MNWKPDPHAAIAAALGALCIVGMAMTVKQSVAFADRCHRAGGVPSVKAQLCLRRGLTVPLAPRRRG